MPQMASVAGRSAVSKVNEALQVALEEVRAARNNAQVELAEIRQRQNFDCHSATPAFANGAHVYVPAPAADELLGALQEIPPEVLGTLGPRNVIVTREARPWVEAAVDVPRPCSSGSVRYRGAPKLKRSMRRISQGTFSSYAACRLRRLGDDTMTAVGWMRRCGLLDHKASDAGSDSRRTHSTGERPHGEPFRHWSFGICRKGFKLKRTLQKTRLATSLDSGAS